MSNAKSPNAAPNAPKKSLLSSAMLDELTDPAIPDDVRADLTPAEPEPKAAASTPAAKPTRKRKGGAKPQDEDAEFAQILERPVQVSAAADVPSTKTVSLRLDSKLARRVKMIAMTNEFEGQAFNTMTNIMEDALRKWCIEYYRELGNQQGQVTSAA